MSVLVGALGAGTPALAPAGASTTADTITFAEAPGANPNYIFPFMGCAYYSVRNVNQFQQLMYRPLYWFGLGGSSAYVAALSPASSPVFSHHNTTVTIEMKGWRFADGQVVNARSVMFFLNMYKADPSNYCGYNSGYGIPDQVASAAGRDNSVTINFTRTVNPRWILYNYLSEVTPMPNAWDTAGHGVAGQCSGGAYGAASTKTACLAVEHYLDAQSATPSTFTDPMWSSGVDGPWRLTAFDALGNATFQPNPMYSGPQRGAVHFVREVAFTSAPNEENQLQSGSLSIGYLDPAVLTRPAPKPGALGPNWGQLSRRYNIYSGSQWAISYAPFNFSASDPKAAAIAQLYVRQALQMAVDQPGIIAGVFKGYGFPVYSPLPPNTPATLSGPVANHYPFNLKAAKALLTSHGWTLQNGVMTCTAPGDAPTQCGAGIVAGYTLNLRIIWASGSPSLDQTFNAEIADWAQIGVQFTHATGTLNSVVSSCSGASGFEICGWNGGWTYAPDYYPSGENLFSPGAVFNVGSFTDPRMTSLITATTTSPVTLAAYAKYAAQQLPVLYQPQSARIVEVARALRSSIGFTPSPLGNFMPEYMHF